MAELVGRKDNFGKNVAIGVTGVALAAGAVAAGAALANKKTRIALKKGVVKTAKRVQKLGDVIEQGREKYQAFQHKIAPAVKKGKRASAKRR